MFNQVYFDTTTIKYTLFKKIVKWYYKYLIFWPYSSRIKYRTLRTILPDDNSGEYSDSNNDNNDNDDDHDYYNNNNDNNNDWYWSW